MSSSWFSDSVERAFERLQSSSSGLGKEEAANRLARYGANALPAEKVPSLLERFFSQFKSPLIYILLVASAALAWLGESMNSAIILGILLFNAVVGVVQEGRAQNTLRALRSFIETNATVIRGGVEYIILDREVVPGDVLIVQEGERVAADARIVLASGLRIDESSLTGESLPVSKTADTVQGEVPVAEQRNMLFKGTYVSSGHGQALVVATGSATFIGGIARSITGIESDVPLKKSIEKLSRRIIGVVGGITLVLFISGVVFGHSVREMFAVVVSLAVSVIPEGLPIVMTLVLATGVWRMSKRNVLVKKLQAVEALGQADIIAVDKTGTLTRNELVVRKVWADATLFTVSGEGYEPTGTVQVNAKIPSEKEQMVLAHIAASGARLSSAHLSYIEESKKWRIAGDPTEACLIVLGSKLGVSQEELLHEAPLVAEIPFDYKRKYHATVHRAPAGSVLTVVGAPETILASCTRVSRAGVGHALTNATRAELEETYTRMSGEGLRLLAFAERAYSAEELTPEDVHSLTFLGFMGIEDTLRREVAEAVSRAEAAGIRVVMITGDHVLTARAIGKEAGIWHEGDNILSGEEIDTMLDPELALALAGVTVFARVTPEHKARIIEAYRRRNEVVAMTGDGVNDAPSLVAADLGVAMGTIGTEVAKEAADIVLTDDNFGSIVSAIEEGRSIYKTIKKVILYLFSTSAGEVLTIAGGLFMGLPLPVLAVQIIWLNFVTDGFLDVSLAMEPKERNLLARTTKKSSSALIDARMVRRMVVMALPMMIGTLFLFGRYLELEPEKAWTVSLTVLAVFQWFNAWNCRSETESLFHVRGQMNQFLIGATAIVIALQLAAVYVPFMQVFLSTVPLSLHDWLLIVAVASSIVVVEEVRKFLSRNTRFHF